MFTITYNGYRQGKKMAYLFVNLKQLQRFTIEFGDIFLCNGLSSERTNFDKQY